MATAFVPVAVNDRLRESAVLAHADRTIFLIAGIQDADVCLPV
jgi:hypothetical protein